MNKLIYDRTQADVETAQTHQSDSRDYKGSYNYVDLNRIEEWCEYLESELNDAGYITNLTTKTDWDADDFPTQAQLTRIVNNVRALKNAFYAISNVPSNATKMTYQKANQIEKVLNEIYRLMWGMEEWYVYSGVSRIGQPRLWQNRFRHFFTPTRITGDIITTELDVALITEGGEELEADER